MITTEAQKRTATISGHSDNIPDLDPRCCECKTKLDLYVFGDQCMCGQCFSSDFKQVNEVVDDMTPISGDYDEY